MLLQFFLTIIYGIVIMYIFSIFGIYYLSDMFVYTSGYECSSLFLCWMTVLHYGLTSGSSITFLSSITSDDNPALFFGRIIYDIGFYILINICIVNITIGLLATAFGNLKQDDDERKLTLETECFICSQDQSAFI